jgi:HK97 family phage major capsid protein
MTTESKKQLTRNAHIVDGGINAEDNTITISFSSETPVLRWFGYEILSHANGDADFGFANSGNCPFLLDHNTTDSGKHIGVVQRAWIENGRGYATIALSTDDSKQGIIGDIKNGVRTNVSFGYSYFDEKVVGKIDGVDAYRMKFKIHEISSVSVPADETVGTNRAFEPIENKPQEKTMTTETPEKQTAIVDEGAIRAAAVKAANTRASEISQLCSQWGMAEKAIEYITSERSVLDVKADILAAVEERSSPNIPKAPVAVKQIGDKDNYNRTAPFSFVAALRAMDTGDWSGAGRERESSQEMARLAGKRHDGDRIFLDPNQMVTRATSSVAPGSGGEFIGQQYMPERLVDTLWAKSALSQLSVDSVLGIQGMAVIPVTTSKATGTWVGGDTAATSAAQGVTTSQLTMQPKALTTHSSFSRLLNIQSNPNIEARVYDQLFKAIAQSLDDALFSPTQIANAPASVLAAITQVIAGSGANGNAPSQSLIVKLIDTIEKLNLDPESIGFVTNTTVKNTLAQTLKDSTNTNSNYILPSFEHKTLYGKPLALSNNIPSSLTRGTGLNLSALIAGIWSDLSVGQWGSIEVVRDDKDTFNDQQIHVKSFSYWDALVKRSASFAAIKDIITL